MPQTTTHTYEATYEQMRGDEVVGSVEVRAVYTFYPGCNDYWDKSVGVWLPGDPDEIEVQSYLVEHGDSNWVKPDKDLESSLELWIDDRWDDMREQAILERQPHFTD
jgi:hypothetical protein